MLLIKLQCSGLKLNMFAQFLSSGAQRDQGMPGGVTVDPRLQGQLGQAEPGAAPGPLAGEQEDDG